MDEPDYLAIIARRKERAVLNSSTQDRDPAKVARSQQLARKLGVAPANAEANFETFSRQVHLEENRAAIRRNPWLASFLGDPDAAALASKDVEKLGTIGSALPGPVSVRRALGTTALTTVSDALRPSKDMPFSELAARARSTPAPEPINWSFERGASRTGGLLYAGAAGSSRAVTGLALSAAEQGEQIRMALGFGKSRTATFLRDYAAMQKQIYENQRPDIGEGVYAELMQGIESVPVSLAAGYLAMRGNVGAGLAMMGATVGGQEYLEGRAQGLSPNAAVVYGTGQGATEAAWEASPFKFLRHIPGAGEVGKKALGFMVREVGSEVGTEITQQFNRWATIESNQGKTFGQFVEELPVEMRGAALGALAVSGAIGGAQKVAELSSRRRQTDVDRIGFSMRAGEWLGQFMKASEDVEMRKLDPESYKTFIEQQVERTETPVRDIYVPVEAIERVLEQGDVDPQSVEIYRDQIEEAQRTRGDIVIPLADAAAHLAGTPLWEAIQEDVRVTAGSLSPRQAKEDGETLLRTLEQRGEEIAGEALGEAEKLQPVVDVYKRAKAEMLGVGLPEAQAEANAQIFAAQREVAAGRAGMSIPDYEKLRPVSFARERKTRGGRRVAQAPRVMAKTVGNNPIPKPVDDVDDEGDVLHARYAVFDESGDAYVRYWRTRDGETVIQSMASSPTIRGRDIVRWLASRFDTPPVVVEAIPEAMGFWERMQKEGLVHSVEGADGDPSPLEQESVPVDEELFSYKQGDKKVRGEARFYESGSKIVNLFATADASTMIHELGHVFLEEMFEDARLPNAPQALKDDVDRIKAWMKENGHEVTDTIPTEAHELWARSFERYMREGKAPSAELRGAFAAFRSWLLKIYKTVAALKAPITPEIREVMDRMLATEQAIADNAIAPMSREALGMTEAEYAAYLESVKGARDEAHDTLLEKMMAAIRRRETKRMREQRDNVKADVAAEINQRPEFVALHLLRTGAWLSDPERPRQDVKLHTGWLIDSYGEDVLQRLPLGLPVTRGDGFDGDTIAEMVGLPSGDALVQALLETRIAQDALKEAGDKRSPRAKLIDDETDRIMAERHGDIAMSEESIQEEAVAALNSRRQGEVIATEIRQLAKRTTESRGPTPYQIAREWARRKINAGKVIDVASRAAVQRYIRATNKARTEAEQAILDGKPDEAFRQKQAQMLNHALLAESKAAADEVEAIVKRMKTLAGRATMKSVDQDYFDRVHQLLERFEFRPRSQASLDEQEGFHEWAAAQIDKGLEVHIPSRLLDVGDHYTRVTVDDLLALKDAVDSLMHLGRLKQKILDAKAERDFNDLRDEITGRLALLPARKLNESPIDREENETWRAPAAAAAELLKIETIADLMDGDAIGPWNRLLVQGATLAANERETLTEQVITPLAKLYASLSKEHRRRLDGKVTIPELTWNTLREGDPRLGQTVTMTRMQLLVVALNSGNVSNLEKVSRGERWPMPVIQSVLQRELNKADWDFVDAIWRGLDGLWTDIVRTERELSGVVPERVVPMEIETRFGPYQGGYWPVVYDAARSQEAENNAVDEAADLFGFRSGVATSKGHTITRTNARGPINFSLEEILLHHTEKVVTRIAYAAWARDVMRVVMNPKIRGMIDTKIGPEYRKKIRPWLQGQIAGNSVDRRGTAWWESKMRVFRTHMSITTMGFAFSTGMAQTLGLGFSIGRLGATGQKKGHLVGLRYMAQGIRRMLSPTSTLSVGAGALAGGLLMGPIGVGAGMTLATVATGKLNGFHAAEAFVFSRSPEMARRGQEMNREMIDVFQKLRGGKAGWWTNAQAMAFWHIGMIDRYLVSMPTWLGGHQKGLDEGLTDEEASHFADKMVRLSQGSGRRKDLSAIQAPDRGFGWQFATMFYTPFNVQFNAQWESVQAAKSGDWRKAIVLTNFFLIATALADALMSGDWPEEGEDEALGFDDLAAWFGRNVFFSLFAGVPVVRDVANSGERKIRGEYASGWNIDPVGTSLEAIAKAGKGSYDIAFEDKEVTGKYIKDISVASGYFFGLPGGQVGKTAGFLWDASDEDSGVDPETVRDWYSGLAYGKLPKKEEEKEP